MTSVSFNSRTTSLAFSDTCESVVVSLATATGLLLCSVTIGFGSTAALSVDVVAPLVFSVGVPVVPPPHIRCFCGWFSHGIGFICNYNSS